MVEWHERPRRRCGYCREPGHQSRHCDRRAAVLIGQRDDEVVLLLRAILAELKRINGGEHG